MKKLLLGIFILVSLNSHAAHFEEFSGVSNIKIVYQIFGSHKGSKGSMVISPGRTESSIKYQELANIFIAEGYSPIYVINHRGQGFSGRMLADPHKGHVNNFHHYSKDFNTFVELILKNENTDKKKLYLLAHSMGGAISMDYLQNYQHPFKKVILSSPMLGIKLERSELSTLLLTKLMCLSKNKCNDYAPGKKPYSEENVIFENNDLTSDQNRFYEKIERWREYPELQLGGATLKWVQESIKANRLMRTGYRLKKLRGIELKIFQAQADTVVNNNAQDLLCNRLNSVMKIRQCEIIKYPNALHEIYMENDLIRMNAIHYLFNFFK